MRGIFHGVFGSHQYSRGVKFGERLLIQDVVIRQGYCLIYLYSFVSQRIKEPLWHPDAGQSDHLSVTRVNVLRHGGCVEPYLGGWASEVLQVKCKREGVRPTRLSAIGWCPTASENEVDAPTTAARFA